MNRKLFLYFKLLTYSCEKMFKALQIMLPKMKRKADCFFNDFLFLSKLHAYIPYLTIPYFSINIFGETI